MNDESRMSKSSKNNQDCLQNQYLERTEDEHSYHHGAQPKGSVVLKRSDVELDAELDRYINHVPEEDVSFSEKDS